jgi:hypothetical protein
MNDKHAEELFALPEYPATTKYENYFMSKRCM